MLCNDERLSDVEKAIYAAVSDAILTAETSLHMVRPSHHMVRLVETAYLKCSAY